MHLIAQVFEAIRTDADDQAGQSERLAWEYHHATPDQQEVIDRVWIALCGWSLRTFLVGHHEATPTDRLCFHLEHAIGHLQAAIDTDEMAQALLYGEPRTLSDTADSVAEILHRLIENEEDPDADAS
jgi:hypothetical protein